MRLSLSGALVQVFKMCPPIILYENVRGKCVHESVKKNVALQQRHQSVGSIRYLYTTSRGIRLGEVRGAGENYRGCVKCMYAHEKGASGYSLHSTTGVTVRHGSVPSPNAASSALRTDRANTNCIRALHLLRYVMLDVLTVRPRYDHLFRAGTMRTQYLLFDPTDR